MKDRPNNFNKLDALKVFSANSMEQIYNIERDIG